MSDLRAFDSQMQKDGYWMHVSGYGHGYGGRGMLPNGGAGTHQQPATFRRARPDYEILMMFASTNILAQHGDQKACKVKTLGSVDDIVTSLVTVKIAYLVMGRGGVFGFCEKNVQLPWDHFKTTTDVNLLVLGTTKADLDAAPLEKEDRFSPLGDFGQQSEKVGD